MNIRSDDELAVFRRDTDRMGWADQGGSVVCERTIVSDYKGSAHVAGTVPG